MAHAPKPILVWFRQDLRLADNPALAAAVKDGPVIPVFILDDETPGKWKTGSAARWWLHYSLEALAADLAKRGSNLILRRGKADKVIDDLIRETDAQAVYWNRLYEPYAIARDTAIKASLEEHGMKVRSFNAALLVEPWTIKTGSDGPYKVFTPFWRTAASLVEDATPLPAPRTIDAPAKWPRSDELTAWRLLPSKPNWAQGFSALWTPGETGARKRLSAFIDKSLDHYADDRDRPDKPATSRLSPHLHWGEIGPRQVWRAMQTAKEENPRTERHVTKFLSEIGWREFSHHLLYHFPTLPERNYRSQFDAFPWERDNHAFKAWTQGRTGYPIVDAGMRELWATGTMHNRVRMVAASFLIKHLMIPWQRGEEWFWDTLVDADLANNAASWQWVAGSGADAAPYFRIFNPVVQGEKFDPDGAYVRRWVRELKHCGPRFIHRPWQSSNFAALAYEKPIVDHDRARTRALAAYKSISDAAGN
ncbi:MAG: deoxyribodipyrimidine photo-lyase [Alphaproteobacteria bacterium]|nr:deoxyribodipyrimidine photo-lyase [Alphaproteobacteria bacterium]